MKRITPALTCLLLIAQIAHTANQDDWIFPDDDLEQRIDRVSEGELNMLARPPAASVHHHYNSIRISAASIEHGWVKLVQCHYHLDRVGSAEIVYHPARIRGLTILSVRNIETSRIDGPSVQLVDIGPDASLCISAESQALISIEAGSFRLKNGPFMRRFLDGYYPMRVSLDIHYPSDLMELNGFRPAPGESGRVRRKQGRILWSSWFEGRLFTEFDFTLTPQAKAERATATGTEN